MAVTGMPGSFAGWRSALRIYGLWCATFSARAELSRKIAGNYEMAKSKTKMGTAVMPSVPAAAVMSFLKDTRGSLTWTTLDLAEALGTTAAEAAKVLAIMEMQGYVKPVRDGPAWLTTPAGETVSGSK